MLTMTQTTPTARRPLAQRARIKTTLYDMVAAINEEIEADEDEVVVATLVHMLQRRRVTCTDGVKTYRLVCHDTPYPSLVGTA